MRLWILFGGYGSRTRRGLGALTVSGETDGWLPNVPDASAEQTQHRQALRESLSDLFSCSGGLLTAGAHLYTASVPILAGASLLVKFPPSKQAADAWHRALHSLREFRQGAPPARVTQHGYSNWPEADSVRCLPPSLRERSGIQPRRATAPEGRGGRVPDLAFPSACGSGQTNTTGTPILRFKSYGNGTAKYSPVWRAPSS